LIVLFRSLLSVRISYDISYDVLKYPTTRAKWKNHAICRDANNFGFIFSLIYYERIIRRETRQARAIANFGEYRNAKCNSREIKDRQRYNFGEFNSQSHERDVKKAFAQCLQWNSPKSYWSEYPKSKKSERKNINTWQTLNILLIVDHNFTTIFRQPDGSAG